MNLFQRKKLSLAFLITILLLTGCFGEPSVIKPDISSQNGPTLENDTEVIIKDQPAFDKLLGKDFLSINQVQGSDHISPFNRQEVTDLAGVVTVKKADGFYIQSIQSDNDPETSEGIFVFTNRPPNVQKGDWVLVSGRVVEFYPGGLGYGGLSITQIQDPEFIIASSGNDIPAPVLIGEGGRPIPDTIIDDDEMKTFDLSDGIDFFESLESMLVQINNPVVVGPTSYYKEIAVLVDNGLNASGRNSRGGITITPDESNPERIILDDSLVSLPDVAVGDQFGSPIIGVMDYTFGNFKVQPVQKVTPIHNNLEPEKSSIAPKKALSVATYNVENLSGADSDERFSTLARQIVENLNAPDIIALQEVQDNNGSENDKEINADLTYKKIIDAIVDANGPEYKWIDIPPVDDHDGGEPGGNIRVGILYRPESLVLYEITAGKPTESVGIDENGDLTLNPGRIDPKNFAFVNSRKPMIAEFLYNKEKVFIIVNHFNSKGGDNPLYGSIQPPRRESEITRKLQSKIVAGFVKQLMDTDPNANIIVVGDLNDFYFSESVKNLTDVGLQDLLMELPQLERYTYNYDGNSQNLDNFLISPALKTYFFEIDAVHLNSEFPSSIRFSDHDPLLARFVFP